MYRYFGEQAAYGLFNTIAFYFLVISCFFYYNTKKANMGFWSKNVICIVSRKNNTLSKIATFILASVESLVLAFALSLSTFNNVSFGDTVGTGANYFATLIYAPLFWCLASLILFANPIKQIDIATLFAPSYLFFVKLACFFNGCCWGIAWEHGLYNSHYDHPGKQVPVQAIEAFFALAIYVFLLIYRKKAKPGTVYPMYLILYSFTRFFSEFLTAAYPDVLGPFNTYQILCTLGFVIGLILFFIMRKRGEKLSDFFDSIPLMMKEKIRSIKEQKALSAADAKAQEEIAEKERLEKVRLAREKAKARKK